jgi:hypothetical protein
MAMSVIREYLAAVMGAVLAIGFFLAGCGGSSTHTTTISRAQANGGSSTHTTTISRAQANAFDNCIAQATSPQHCFALPGGASGGVVVTECGGGLSTTSGCVFADNVKRAYDAARTQYGVAPKRMTVTTNPVTCSTAASGWRCQSQRNRAVWVFFIG